jgi:GNAT superfamily N-acetyltransferase
MVIEITEEKVKQNITNNILSSLPDWFGIPESVQVYVRQSSKMPFFAYKQDGQYIGFAFLKIHNIYSAEICAMGVLPQHHRQGVGRMLINKCIDYCRERNIEFLQVKTLDSSFDDGYYQITRDFYEAMGFRPFECIPSLWNEENPCLIMIMHIGRKTVYEI